MTTTKTGSSPSARPRMHPPVLRLMHWTNAAAMIVMILSGWKIYNDDVLFGILHFPDGIVLGIWAQHALQWHFMGMWVLVINGLFTLPTGWHPVVSDAC
jgi:thiosulfate reductase cytochrome b subunit